MEHAQTIPHLIYTEPLIVKTRYSDQDRFTKHLTRDIAQQGGYYISQNHLRQRQYAVPGAYAAELAELSNSHTCRANPAPPTHSG